MNDLDIALEGPAELARLIETLPWPERRRALLKVRRLRPDLAAYECSGNRFEIAEVRRDSLYYGKPQVYGFGDLGPLKAGVKPVKRI
jgi:hypothetical protein